MDKKFVMGIAAMAALTLVSCSSDDLDSVSDNSSKNEAISFDGYLGRSAVAVNGTRGSVETVETLKKNGFGVFSKYAPTEGEASFPDFANQQVTYKYSKWTYSPIKYWPTKAGHIDFYAYAPYDSKQKLIENSKLEFEVNPTVTEQKDLLWSRVKAQINTPIINNNNKVSFKFAHALSRLGYTIKLHEIYPSATFTLKKITLAGSPDENTKAFYTKGIIDLSKVKDKPTDDVPAGLWNTSTSDKQNFDWVSVPYKVGQATSYNPNDGKDKKDYLFVIPQDFSKEKDPQKPTEVVDELYVIVQYTITYSDGGGEQTNTVYKQIKKKFEQGKAYMLNLTIGLPIEFDVDLTEGVGVDNWGKEDGIDIGSGSNDNLWDGIE